jgi:hypothetical protein
MSALRMCNNNAHSSHCTHVLFHGGNVINVPRKTIPIERGVIVPIGTPSRIVLVDGVCTGQPVVWKYPAKRMSSLIQAMPVKVRQESSMLETSRLRIDRQNFLQDLWEFSWWYWEILGVIVHRMTKILSCFECPFVAVLPLASMTAMYKLCRFRHRLLDQFVTSRWGCQFVWVVLGPASQECSLLQNM